MAEANMRTAILDAAERDVRQTGYNGVSFRDIAAAVGIKSASVHYHFPTKADLGSALATRYTDRFMDALGDPDDEDASVPMLIGRFVGLFRQALVDDKSMCLCGIFAAELSALPAPVVVEARRFFEETSDWLTRVFRRDGGDARSARDDSLALLALLEGALIVARALGDTSAFDRIAVSSRLRPLAERED